ncbi:MAG: hypothetical protein R2818_07180 [Flavobacteriales bacterium]
MSASGMTPSIIRYTGATEAVTPGLPGSNTPRPTAQAGSDDIQVNSTGTWAAPKFQVAFMDPLTIGIGDTSGTGAPSSARNVPPYVLPEGAWWIGAYAGIGTVSGNWRGAGTKDLDQAEQWNSTGQAGVIAGREWRSGWGISAGLGVATVRSRFDFATNDPSYTVLDVDTSWAEYTHTSSGVPLYSWVIDSVLVDRPGATSRINARNEYAAVQVPLSLHWHTQVRRMRLGAFGGVMAWVPTGRSGTTLSSPTMDGTSLPVTLQGENLDDRFAAQLHGQLGLSLGYSITEHFTAFAEPLVSTPILSFGGADTPWLTRPTLQLRIQYELRSRRY